MTRALASGDRVSATIYGESKVGTVTRMGRSSIAFVMWDGAARECWQHRASLTVIPPACDLCFNAATHRAYGDTGVAFEVCADCLADHTATINAGDCPGCGQRRDLCASDCTYPLPSDFSPIVEA